MFYRIIFSRLSWLALTCVLLAELRLYAHTSSTSFLEFEAGEQQITGRWKIDALDLNKIVLLDHNGDRKITWGEIKASQNDISKLVMPLISMGVSDGELCPLTLSKLSLQEQVRPPLVVLDWTSRCRLTPGSKVSLHYNFLFDVDATHLAIASISGSPPVLFKVDQRTHSFSFENAAGPKRYLPFIEEGIHHIFIGFDHILFIATLIIAVVAGGHRREGREIFKVVSAFTIAHSLTLFLVCMGFLKVPGWMVESAIAFSIVVGALNNIFRFIPGSTAKIAFAFGLIHGFGFANVLGELPTNTFDMVWAVFLFNVGVEIGQLVIVCGIWPLFHFLKGRWYFKPWMANACSSAIILVGVIWTVERLFDIAIF